MSHEPNLHTPHREGLYKELPRKYNLKYKVQKICRKVKRFIKPKKPTKTDK